MTPDEEPKRLTRGQARIRDRFLRRMPPDELTHVLAEGVARGELEYVIETGKYRLTRKGEERFSKALEAAGDE